MKSREPLIRLKRFQIEEKRKQVAQIETMIAEFDRMADELDREIKAEEQKSGISDTSHFAYPTYAKAAMVRRDNLKGSALDLRFKLEDARLALEEACQDLTKIESREGRARAEVRDSVGISVSV